MKRQLKLIKLINIYLYRISMMPREVKEYELPFVAYNEYAKLWPMPIINSISYNHLNS